MSKYPKSINKELVNPDPSKEARGVISYLADTYGKGILSGQHEAEFPYRPELDRILEVTGKLPAIRSMDFLNYSSAMSWPDDVTERAMDWYLNKGGLVTICWHWYSPMGGKPVTKSFYTSQTDFDIRRLLNKGTPEHAAAMKDMEIVGRELARLRDAGVPVLWRPFHEADGAWFWWGAHGPGPCKDLYRLMYERFTYEFKLNNLIWVWTFAFNELNTDWYPGHDCVDIIGIDKYFPAGDYNPNKEGFEALLSFGGDIKLIAMTENGPIPDPDLLIGEEAKWLWFCPWFGDFVTDGKCNTPDHLYKVYNHPYVITLDKLPDLKSYE
ncbi:MAG TPA: glycosyl hydrolase [Candidatus Atribacteria bacterium]|nr:glycosyl hydrolase [Candidatus Atribacteria bacterium]HPT78154.1 glycosyl hydrolase [Candidatus Atribacteria bacterium]